MSWEFTFKLILKTPMIIPKSASQIDHSFLHENNTIRISASTIRGAAHREFQQRADRTKNDKHNSIENTLFGDQSIAARMMFTDFECKKPVNSNQFIQSPHQYYNINGITDTTEQIFNHNALPVGTELIGRVKIEGTVNGLERSIALTTVLDILNLGPSQARGFGSCDIEILDRSSTIVFVSYTWEDNEHMEWVLNLSRKLMDNGISVVLDQLSPTFNPDDSQEKINEWMTNSINNADKIIAILTPTYQIKAEKGIGGTGYEFNQLRSELGTLSEKLNRYLCVLKSGNRTSSLPVELKNRPVFDMCNRIEDNFAELLASVLK